jgi:hypothetical protein
MAYTPPSSNNVNFQLNSYIPPNAGTITFELEPSGGIIYEVSHIESNTINDILNQPLVNYISSRVENNNTTDIINIPLINYTASVVEVTTAIDSSVLVTPVNIIENNTVSDILNTPLLILGSSIIENTSASDTTNVIANLKPAIIELNSVTDVLSISTIIYRISHIENNSANDSQQTISAVSVNENNSVIDNNSININLNIERIELNSAIDISVAITDFNQTQNENFISESIQNSNSILQQNIIESTTVIENVLPRIIFNFVELNEFQSNQSCIVTSNINYNENFILNDFTSASIITSTSRNENNNVTDTINENSIIFSESSDTNTALEESDSSILYRISANEPIQLNDNPSLIFNYTTEVEETFNLTSNENVFFSTEQIEPTNVKIIGTTADEIASFFWKSDLSLYSSNTAGNDLYKIKTDMDFLNETQMGNWAIENNQLIMYNQENKIIIAYNLFNKEDQPNMIDVFKRELVS